MGEIAEQMQRTKSAVRTRALKLNIAIARAENSMQRGKRAAPRSNRQDIADLTIPRLGKRACALDWAIYCRRMNPTPFRGPPAQFSALDHIARARQFRRGADKLEDMESAEPNWPKYALLGHAVELALKAVPKYFEQSETYQKPNAAKPANHDLVGQYDWAKLHGLASNQLVEADLPLLSELHKDHYARYPQALRPVCLPSEFDDLVDQIIADVETIMRLR